MIEGAYPKLIVSNVDEIVKEISDQREQYIVKQLVSLDIDPDVLAKQTMEIQRLHDELEKYRWIPVTERLPEEEGEYLCWMRHFGRKNGRFRICKFTKDAYNFDKNDFDYYEGEKKALFYKYDSEYGFYEIDVVAWMPLPEPYEEVEE